MMKTMKAESSIEPFLLHSPRHQRHLPASSLVPELRSPRAVRGDMVRTSGNVNITLPFAQTGSNEERTVGVVRCGRRENDELMWRGRAWVAREDMQRAR